MSTLTPATRPLLTRLVVPFAMVLLAAPLSACAGGTATPGAASPTGSATAPATTVTLTRTGGLAGVNEQVTVEPDGSWTYVGRSGKDSGRLGAADLATLVRLVTDPGLAGAGASPTPGSCADGFTYRLSAGDVSTGAVDCGTLAAQHPTLAQVVDLLVRATPM
jgi:hypothetical protein